MFRGYCHTSNSWESMGKLYMQLTIRYYKSRENPYQCCKSPENPYQALQVPCNAFEHAMKSKVGMIVPSYTGKKLSPDFCSWHCYMCCTLVTNLCTQQLTCDIS